MKNAWMRWTHPFFLLFFLGTASFSARLNVYTYLPGPLLDGREVVINRQEFSLPGVLDSGQRGIEFSCGPIGKPGNVYSLYTQTWQINLRNLSLGANFLRVRAIDELGNKTSYTEKVLFRNLGGAEGTILDIPPNTLIIDDIAVSLPDQDAPKLLPVQIYSRSDHSQLYFTLPTASVLAKVSGIAQGFDEASTITSMNQIITNVISGNTVRVASVSITLQQGYNTINCVVIDKLGKTTLLGFLGIISDYTPPVIELTFLGSDLLSEGEGGMLSDTKANQIPISLRVYDNNQVKILNAYWNNALVYTTELNGTSQKISFAITPPSVLKHNSLKIECYDLAGNRSEKVYKLNLPVPLTINGPVLNYPNPMRSRTGTTFQYSLSRAVNIRLILFDLASRVVMQEDIAATNMGASEGINHVNWDGRDRFGDTVGSGVYLLMIYHDSQRLGSGKVLVIND